MLNTVPFLTHFASRLTAGAPMKTEARQKARNAAEPCTKTSPAFLPTADTYFVKTDTVNNRYTVVLGWNHALLLQRKNGEYVPVLLFCHGDGGGKGAYGNISEMKELKRDEDAPVAELCDEDWTVRRPPEVALERLVTYGVSSCSFSVLASAGNFEYIAVSHMSGEPPIPVAAMMKFARVKASNFVFFASALPQEAELQKFSGNTTLKSAQIRGQVAVRGRMPAQGDGSRLYPQLTHSEIGLRFPPGKPPVIDGILGLESDHNYSRLLPTGWFKRLKDFSTVTPGGDNLYPLFEAAYKSYGAITPEVRHLFEDYGHTLPPNARVVRENMSGLAFGAVGAPTQSGSGHLGWKIELPHQGGVRRSYIVRTEIGSRTSHQVNFSYTVTEDNATREGTYVEQGEDLLASRLDLQQPILVRPALEAMGLANGEDATLQTIQAGKQWRLLTPRKRIVISLKGRSEKTLPSTRLRYLSNSEPDDVVEDIIDPLLAGALGFAGLHDEIITSFSNRLLQRGAAKVWLSMDVFTHFQRNLYLEYQPSWQTAAKRKQAVAKLLGDFLVKEDPSHPYADLVAAAVLKYRYSMEIPLSTL